MSNMGRFVPQVARELHRLRSSSLWQAAGWESVHCPAAWGRSGDGADEVACQRGAASYRAAASVPASGDGLEGQTFSEATSRATIGKTLTAQRRDDGDGFAQDSFSRECDGG